MSLVIASLLWFAFMEEADHSAEKAHHKWPPEDILERVYEMAHVDIMYLLV